MNFFKKLKCFFERHEVRIISELSLLNCDFPAQAVLVECRHCKKKFALKAEGEYAGALLPWETAKEIYHQIK